MAPIIKIVFLLFFASVVSCNAESDDSANTNKFIIDHNIEFNVNDIENATLFIDVFDVNGGIYSNKLININSIPIGLLPSNTARLKSWQTVSVKFPPKAISCLSLSNTVGIVDKTLDPYNIRNICIKIKTKIQGKDSLISIINTNTFCSTDDWWPLKEGEKINLNGKPFATLDKAYIDHPITKEIELPNKNINEESKGSFLNTFSFNWFTWVKTYLVWFLFFSSIHYLLIKFKCPITLIPAISFSGIVILLYISGLLGSLHYGYFLFIALSVFGFALAVFDKKKEFWKAYILQPKELWIFNFISLIFLVQSVFLSDGVTLNDDMHHWLFVMKGMGFYHSFKNFHIIHIFKNYTLGQAVWGYFINRLCGYSFSIVLGHWSNTLVYAICFIPGLAFFQFEKNKISLLSLFLFISSFVGFCFSGVIYLSLGFLAIAIGLLLIPRKTESYIAVIGFFAYLFLYSFIIIIPNYDWSNYRNLAPDVLIFIIPASCLLAYLSNCSLKTLIFISPLLAIGYLFKVPGLYLSVTAGLSIIIHFIIARRSLLIKSFKKKRNICILLILALFSIFVSLLLPPKIWNLYCSVNEYNKKAVFKFSKFDQIDNIKKCFFDKNDPTFYRTRTAFWKKFYNNKIFNINLDKNGPLGFAVYVDEFLSGIFKSKIKPGTYPKALIATFLLGIFSLFLIKKNRFKCFYIIFFSVLIFTLLHVFGLVVNYCLMFDSGGEKYTIPAYQRYSATMLKLFIVTVAGGFLICLYQKDTAWKKFILSVLLLIFSFSLCKSANFKMHTYKHEQNQRELFEVSLFPRKFDFSGKKLLVIGSHVVPRQGDKMGLLYLDYNYSCPKFINYMDIFDSRGEKYISNYDYILYLEEDIFDKNKLKDNTVQRVIADIVKDDDFLNRPALFEIAKSNDFTNLKMIYQSPIFPSNVLFNSDFELGFDGWELSHSHIKLNNTNGFTSVILPRKCTITQMVNVKKDRNYIIKFNVNSKTGLDVVGYFGANPLYVFERGSIKLSDLYFHSSKDGRIKLKISNPTSLPIEISDILVLDMGE